METRKIIRILLAFGMAAAVFYLGHAIVGNLLWSEYNPITTDVSTLTSVGAPNRNFLLILTYIYGICSIIFAVGMIISIKNRYNKAVKIGMIIFLIMQIVSLAGYSMFPLDGHVTEGNFNNTMHIAVTGVVVFFTLLFAYFVSIGYIKQAKTKKLGTLLLILTIILTLAGISNVFIMNMGLNIMGISERFVLYSLQTMVFFISFYEVFCNRIKII